MSDPLLHVMRADVLSGVKPNAVKSEFVYKPFPPFFHMLADIEAPIIYVGRSEVVKISLFEVNPTIKVFVVWLKSLFVMKKAVDVFTVLRERTPVLPYFFHCI